ncbi:MAG: SCO family protein [Chitinophagaceae bacterium]|nr:MAG: SCO family protein [Chitinophagaceae bacterium]
MKLKQIFIPVFSLAVCLTILYKWTRGFSAFTIYSYILEQAGPVPRQFPSIQFINQDGNIFDIKDRHQYVLVNFVYLDCPGVCQKIDNKLEDIYHSLDTAIIPSRLALLTVSFDLKNDNINKIKQYRNFFGTKIDGWTFAVPYKINGNEFHQFLQKIGFWTYQIPGTGIINHSVYMFLISPDDKIIKVFDPARENNSSIIEQILQCVKTKQIASVS